MGSESCSTSQRGGKQTVCDLTMLCALYRHRLCWTASVVGEWGISVALGSFHNPLQSFLVRDRVGKNALDGAVVEVHQNLKKLMELPESSKR